MTRALVLGAYGFLGHHVVAALREASVDVVAGPSRDELDLAVVAVDQLAALVAAAAPDVVVNATGRTVGSDDELLHDNRDAVATLAAACARVRPGLRLVHLGSAAEYDAVPDGIAVTEASPARPQSAYGRAKLAATDVLLAAGLDGSVDPLVLRVFNPLGKGQPESTLPGRVARQLAKDVGPLVLGPLDMWRDFVSARDVGRAVVAGALVPSVGATVVNVGSGVAVPVRALVNRMAELAGGRDVVEGGDGSPRSGGLHWQRADVTLARQTLHWRPLDSLDVAIGAVLDGVSAAPVAR